MTRFEVEKAVEFYKRWPELVEGYLKSCRSGERSRTGEIQLKESTCPNCFQQFFKVSGEDSPA